MFQKKGTYVKDKEPRLEENKSTDQILDKCFEL